MKYLKMYVKTPSYQSRFTEIDQFKSLPFILENENTSVTEVLIRNESDKVLFNLSLSESNLPDGAVLYSAIGNLHKEFQEEDYIAGLDHSEDPLLKELFPYESVKIRIKITYPSSAIIDFNVFSLDLDYSASFIPVSDLEAFFEFSEKTGSNIIESSYPNLSGIVHQTNLGNIISGSGRALFRNATDRITFDSPALSEAFIYFKGIIDLAESDSPILNIGNFEFGLNSQRAPYIQIGSQRATGNKYSIDYNNEFAIGISLSNMNDIIFSYNGDKVEVAEDLFETPEVLNISTGSVSTIGYNSTNQFYGDITSLIVYSSAKPISFHSNIASKI